MNLKFPPHFIVEPEIQDALRIGEPIVALESTVISHGLPFPDNLHLARDMENIIRTQRVKAATIAILNGRVRIGLKDNLLEHFAQEKKTRKISVRDVGSAIAQKATGGTTVAGTLTIADKVGIKVFATGGIGGVHRGAPFDISADLPQLAKSPVVVVCAGAKSILDLPATLEYLETMSVPVVGYQTEDFPAFFVRESGLKVTITAKDAKEAASIARAHWEIGHRSAVLVVAPPPLETAMDTETVDEYIEMALVEAEKEGVKGQAVTPFLLEKLVSLSGGSSLKANLALLKNNAQVASEIAKFLYRKKDIREA